MSPLISFQAPARVNAFTAVLLWVLALVCAGCMPSLESSEPPERTYWLDTTTIDSPADLHLRVSVVPGLDSDRIWVLQADQRLNYYAGAYWPDNLSPLLQSIMARSLNAELKVTGRPTVAVTIERFFAVSASEDAAPTVELRARIERDDGRRCVFESRQISATARLRDVVAAHQQLLDELTRSINDVAGSVSGGESCAMAGG